MKNQTARFAPFLMLVNVAFFFMVSCQPKKDNTGNTLTREQEIKMSQYVIEGKRLYKVHCINCHQLSGEGLGKLYPPLKNSDYLTEKPERLACGVKYGRKGGITVNGTIYNMEMPAIPRLTNLEIAEIYTFVANEFLGKQWMMSPLEVEKALQHCDKDD